MDSIYIQTLKQGFDNPEGISLTKIAKELDVDIHKSTEFNIHYIIWFYENFYNYNVEQFKADRDNPLGRKFRIDAKVFEEINLFHSQNSYIKGDAVNKYIDYLELERTRQSAKQASFFATGSIIIAILAVIFPYMISPEEITTSGRVSIIGIILTLLSFGYSYFSVTNEKPDNKPQKKSFWPFLIMLLVLGSILSYLVIIFLEKLLIDFSLLSKVLIVLPIFVYFVGQIIRKAKNLNYFTKSK